MGKRGKKHAKKAKHGKSKMPPCVVSYFRYRQQGLSKAAARKKSGLSKK